MKSKTNTQVALAAARTALALAKASVKELVEAAKVEKERALQAKVYTKGVKAAAKEEKRQASIQRAQATLARLLNKTNPVGIMAMKAARKPGPVTVTKG